MGELSVIRNTGSSYNGHFVRYRIRFPITDMFAHVRYRKPDMSVRNTNPAAYPITDRR